ASATEFTGDELIEAEAMVSSQYRANAAWVCHRDFVRRARQLKDPGTGAYLWQAALTTGQADLLVGHPVELSEYAPNDFTAGQAVAVLGDFGQGYWVADGLELSMQVLVELFAKRQQVGFLCRKATDAQPVISEAFARLRLAA